MPWSLPAAIFNTVSHYMFAELAWTNLMSSVLEAWCLLLLSLGCDVQEMALLSITVMEVILVALLSASHSVNINNDEVQD